MSSIISYEDKCVESVLIGGSDVTDNESGCKYTKSGNVNTKLQFQNCIPYTDENSDNVVEIPSRPSREATCKVQRKFITHLAKRPAVDIEFQDLSYTVRSPGKREGRRTILNAVSGKFRAGELTAIMGPSGAGKSTLMNILVGYVSAGVSGSIKTNGHPRQMKLFNKLSSYIMQEDLMQPLLNVQESMEFAAQLKLGEEMKHSEKQLAIEEVLNTLGLLPCRNTRTDHLSGGQRKRLSIALELVNNPPVIFLDEPTTGLDIVTIKQCLSMMKTLAQQGRTIICTIHQPNASHFQLFDHVYVLARGQCVYQGASQQLVPFMSTVGLHCPTHYNPADYVIEMVQGEYVENVKLLSAEIQNGKLNKKMDQYTAGIGESVSNADFPKPFSKMCLKDTVMVMPAVFNHALMDSKDVNTDYEFPTSFFQQFCILLRRFLLQKRRNTIALFINFLHHLLASILVGCIFIEIGNDATRTFANVKFCFCILTMMLYTYLMTPVLLFPSAVKLLKREYFNRWYGLKAYYMAVTVASLPQLIVFGGMFCTISYVLSSQPLELTRYLWFCSASLALGFVSEGHGLIVGSMFNVMNGSVVAPASFSPLLALAVYGLGHGDTIETTMTFLMNMSYLRYGLVAITDSIYSHNRPPMDCIGVEFEYCHYKDPGVLLKDLGMAGTSTLNQILVLLGFAFVYRLVAYLVLRYRLTSEFSNQVLIYVAKILRHK